MHTLHNRVPLYRDNFWLFDLRFLLFTVSFDSHDVPS